SRRTCVGIKGGYWANSPAGVTSVGEGAFVTLSYFREKCYQGLWLDAEVGAYLISLSDGNGNKGSANSAAVGPTVAWRGKPGQNVTLQFYLGGKYLTQPNTGKVSYPFANWVYFIGSGLGFIF